MKKIVSALCFAFLFLLFLTPVSRAAEVTPTKNAIYDEIEQTNQKISNLIDNAVAEADKLFANYSKNYENTIETENLVTYQNEINKLSQDVSTLTPNTTEYNSVLNKIKSDKNIIKNNKKIASLDKEFKESLDNLQNNLIATTDNLAAKVIEDAAKEGITVKSEYIKVKLGNRVVLVDPLRVIGS